jgi:PAS domain S-box-containing protein
MSHGTEEDEREALQREVKTLRLRVAELQRAAARHEDTEGVSLAEREELLREAERVSHLGTWTWDLASGRVTWSDEMFRILGLVPGSVSPSVETFFAAVHGDDRARAQAATERSLRDGVLSPVDCRLLRPDGTVRHVTASSSMLFDSQATVRRVVGGVIDRTESIEAELTLRRTLALLEEAQRFAQLGNWRFVPRTGELEWSPEFRRIAGVPLDVPAKSDLFLERVVEEDRPRFIASYRQALTNAQGEQIEGRLRRPDGELRHIRLRGFALVGSDGTPEIRGTMLDVTEQVRLREERAHVQKMEAVGRLAGGIAHDFNNLLTVITGNLELLSTRIGSVTELEQSLQALSSAASLTKRLLAFGRQAQLSLKYVAPNDLVRSTTDLMQRLVGDEVKLEIVLAPSLPLVRVDALEIERALVNLVANARDAMPHGGVVRIATAVAGHGDSLRVELSVADEGGGISEANRPHLFEPFFTTRQNEGGAGLGLATVLGTAEQHGGSVRVESRPEGGSIFTITLPAAPSDTQPDVMGTGELSGPARESRPLCFLVIDDEPAVAKVTRQMLEVQGHTVYVATVPEQAMRIWAERRSAIDLVICDVLMTHMRGPELVARLADGGPPPRVLFITGYSEEGARARLGHPVLAKPFKVAALLRAISEVLGS